MHIDFFLLNSRCQSCISETDRQTSGWEQRSRTPVLLPPSLSSNGNLARNVENSGNSGHFRNFSLPTCLQPSRQVLLQDTQRTGAPVNRTPATPLPHHPNPAQSSPTEDITLGLFIFGFVFFPAYNTLCWNLCLLAPIANPPTIYYIPPNHVVWNPKAASCSRDSTGRSQLVAFPMLIYA